MLFLLSNCCNNESEPDPLTVIDIEGNIYRVVRIGKQLWMKENLKTIRLNNGSSIPVVTDSIIWKSISTPACCWYKNDSSTNKNTYGALYNWYTVSTGLLCPIGWHVPSDDEWLTLIKYLGGQSVAGGKLKESGTIHWNSPNTSANNESGFTALPGGIREQIQGAFDKIGLNGYWWSGTLGESLLTLGMRTYGPIQYYLDCSTSSMNSAITPGYLYLGKNQGNSVRCIKD